MSQQNKTADLNKAVTLYTKRLLHALTEGNPVEQEEVDALNEMREAAGMKPLAIQIAPTGTKANPANIPVNPQPERKQPKSERKPSGQQYTRQQDADADPESVAMVPISVGGNRTDAHLMPDNAQWTNRFMIRSESSNKLYTIAQNKSRRYWGCNCPGWIGHRKCKHLRALGLPANEQPYEAKLNKGASAKANIFPVKFGGADYSELAHVLAAELIHSDNELSKMMEPATPVLDGVPGVAHIDGPEAGPSNDEMHANQHKENGVPVMDGNLVSPERQNVTAIKDAIEGKAEMEIGKPIEQKQEEVDLATEVRDEKLMNPAATQEVSAKPGTQIIINVGSKEASFTLTAEFVRKAAITVFFEGEEAVVDMNGRKYTLQGNDAYNFEEEYNKIQKPQGQVNALVEKWLSKLKPVKSAPKQTIHTPSAPGKPDINSWLNKQPAVASKEASDEGGAWSISGVTPNKETNEDVNKALKRMKATKTAADHVHTPHDPDTMLTVCEYCGIEMEYDGVADIWACADGEAVSDEDLNRFASKEAAAYVSVDDLTSAGQAVMQRIKATKPELVFEYGYDRVLEAAYEATASLTNLEEIGSSDVSIWTKRVEEDLAHSKQGAEGIGGENQSGATNDSAGGMFGGSDLEGPSFHVGFDFRGSRREASFTSLSEAHKFTKAASEKFGKLAGNWTMKCPQCGGQASKSKPEDSYRCGCGWDSHTAVGEHETSPKTGKKASVKKAKEIKQVAPDPAFVEAMVNAVLIDHGARAMELQIPLARLVSIIKTKIKKIVRKGVATISIYVPENDTEYVMQLPADQAEQGNYKFNPGMDPATGLPKKGSADPAKRNLVLELLKGGRRLSTGEIEKALGGGKYTNNAYPVLTELAKEGLVAHKQMRWSLKSAAIDDEGNAVEKPTKSYTDVGKDNREAVGKFAFNKKAFSVQTRVSEGHPLAGEAGLKTIVDQLNVQLAELKKKNPQGFMDSFEQQLETRMLDIAKKHGVQMDHTPEDDTYTFYDQAGASTKGQKHEDLKGINPHTGDPARPESFDHHQQGADKTAYPRKKQMPTKAEAELGRQALRLELDAKNQGAVGIAWAKEGLFGVHNADASHPQEEVRRLVKEAISSGANPQIMFMEQKDADATECLICHELFAQPSDEEEDWTRNYDVERDHKSYTGSLKTATIHIQDGSKNAGDGMAKTVEVDKEAGFNFFFPGQVLKEFYPEVQHEIVDYPNANNQPMGLESPEIVGDGGHELEGVLDEALNPSVIEMIQLPADISDVEPLAMAAADYSSTSPAGGMGIGRDGKPEVLEGAPLRKENDIRGYMFTDEFYGQYEGIPGAAMAVASKTAAEGDEKKQFSIFLKKVCGEIAATMVAAFKVTSRPLLDKVPGIGELQLDQIEQGTNAAAVPGQTTQGGRVKYLMGKLNDGDIKQAINDAWAQAAVWNDNAEGGFVYEVFVRPETIDTDSLLMKYKFIAGTRE